MFNFFFVWHPNLQAATALARGRGNPGPRPCEPWPEAVGILAPGRASPDQRPCAGYLSWREPVRTSSCAWCSQQAKGRLAPSKESTAQKATKESNRDLPQPVAAPEECSSNSATLSRSLATSSSKAASLSSVASDDMPGGGAFGGTRPGCAFATVFPAQQRHQSAPSDTLTWQPRCRGSCCDSSSPQALFYRPVLWNQMFRFRCWGLVAMACALRGSWSGGQHHH